MLALELAVGQALAEMIGATRLEVHSSLLNVVLHD
jgi:hypothetical protein